MTTRTTLYAMLLLLIFGSCKNELNKEITTYECTANLINPSFNLIEINDCAIVDSPTPLASRYGVVAEYKGSCIDFNTGMDIGFQFLDEDDEEVEARRVIAINRSSMDVMGNKIQCFVCFRYGQERTKKVKLDFTIRGVKSEPAYLTINRPEGAN